MNRPPTDATVINTAEYTYHVWANDEGVSVLVGCWAATLTKEEAALLAEALLGPIEREAKHVVKLDRNGWVLKHPLSCRNAGLFDCEYNTAAAEFAWWRVDTGIYECELVDGVLRLL